MPPVYRFRPSHPAFPRRATAAAFLLFTRQRWPMLFAMSHQPPARHRALSTARVAMTLAVLLISLGAMGCSGRRLPSDRAIYREACKAITAEAAAVELASIDACSLYVGKSAARIDVPFKDGSGTYTVWLKRVARTWTVDKLYPADSPPAAG
ncbi:MAG: hypothetical protein O3B24_11240 [Verrucomicrobia bacterium]|nr:hypothetical protein [Verrucomicrobiota bacterium]